MSYSQSEIKFFVQKVYKSLVESGSFMGETPEGLSAKIDLEALNKYKLRVNILNSYSPEGFFIVQLDPYNNDTVDIKKDGLVFRYNIRINYVTVFAGDLIWGSKSVMTIPVGKSPLGTFNFDFCYYMLEQYKTQGLIQ